MHETMHCLHPSVQWQQQESNDFPIENMISLQSDGVCDGWPNLTSTAQSPIPITTRVAATTTTTATTTMMTSMTTMTVSNNSASLVQVGAQKKNTKKRKVHKSPPLEGNDDGDDDDVNEVSKLKEDDAGDSSNLKDNNNAKKPDYIHVRARRGQATDSHSLAERVRRERISERMKYLQGLVPGCNKIAGKAGMLDEIINYVQSLQRQVEFLSLKLAAVNPLLEFNMEALFSKEMNLQCSPAISTQGMSSDTFNPLLLQFNTLQQAMSSFGHDLATNPAEVALGRAMSMPVLVSEPFLDSSFNVQRTISGLNSELDNLYDVDFHQGRGSIFPIQAMQVSAGNILPNNRKMDM